MKLYQLCVILLSERMYLMPQFSDAVLKINEEQANYARKISARMSQPIARRKGLVDILGIMCAIDYFEDCGFKVNNSRSLHRIAEVFEEFKISDIYINNFRIDVISRFRDNKIKIPSVHKEYGCQPDYYVVVDLSERLKEARILGYFKAADVAFLNYSGEYAEVDEIYLKSIRALCLELKKPAYPKQIMGKHLDCMALFLRFIDKELLSSNKKLLIQHLVTCPACAKKLADVIDFNRTVGAISNVSNIINEHSSQELNDEDEILASFKRASMRAKKKNVAPNTLTNLSNDSKVYQKKEFEKYNIIDGIFSNVDKIDTSKIVAMFSGRKKRIAIVASVIFLFLISSIIIAIKNSNSNISSISDIDSEYSQDANYNSKQRNEFTSSQDLPQEVYGANNATDYSLATQMTGEPLVATINKISWEVPENIANKANYARFLQLVGKNVKLNLQNDLLLSNDFAKNSVIKLSIRISSSGEIIDMKILQSSGSVPIDNIIKKSVTETLQYMKPPSHGLISRPLEVVLVISL